MTSYFGIVVKNMVTTLIMFVRVVGCYFLIYYFIIFRALIGVGLELGVKEIP